MIELKNLSVSFGGEPVISNLNADFDVGINALCGASGIGKTTLLRAIAGLQKFEGEIIGTHNNKISFAFQDYRLFDSLSAKANIELCKSQNIDIQKLLADLQIQDFADKKPNELSGGMQARVSLGRALGNDADIVLLDEPFSALDLGLKKAIAKSITPYLMGKTVIIVTHNQEDLELLKPDKIIEI